MHMFALSTTIISLLHAATRDISSVGINPWHALYIVSTLCAVIFIAILVRHHQKTKYQSRMLKLHEACQISSGLTLWQCNLETNDITLYGPHRSWFPPTAQKKSPYKFKWLDFEKIIHPDDKHAAVESYNNLISGIRKPLQTFRVIGRDSSQYSWHSIKIISDYLTNPKPRKYATGYLLDITEEYLKQQKQKAELAESRFILENANCIILRCNEDGIITYFNNFAETFFGYSSDEVIGRHVIGTIVPETETFGRHLRPLIEKITKSPDEYGCSINENIKRSGERVWVAWTNKLYMTCENTGGKREVLSTGLDITKRRMAEEALKASEKEKMTILNSISEGVIFVDISGNILWGNHSAAEITGNDASAMHGKTTNEFFHYKDQEHSCPVSRAIKTHKECHFCGTLPNGIIINMTAVPVFKMGTVCGAVATFLDITEQTELEDQLRYSQKMDAIGQLAGGIAHEFNNKLCGLLGFANLLKETSLNTDQQRYLEAIINSGESCSEQTTQLLAFARKGKFNIAAVNVNEKISSLYTFLAHSLSQSIQIKLDLYEGVLLVNGDENQISNMLLNLAMNASDAMPDGGQMSFKTRIIEAQSPESPQQWSGLRPGKYVEITVTDTGCGIEPEMLEKVFDPFFTTKDISGGSGMGLSAVYGIISGHNGKIDITSELGKGTEVIVHLPLMSSEPKPGKVKPSAAPQLSARILIIEDDKVNQLLLEKELMELGCYVELASNGQDGILKYKKGEFDLVLLDMVMPRLSGRDTFYELQEINPDIKIIIISGYEIDNSIREILAAGALGFIAKPFEGKDISKNIIEALDA